MKCSFLRPSKLRIFVSTKASYPIVDCNFPPHFLHDNFWEMVGERFGIRFDLEENPIDLVKDIVASLNEELIGSKIEFVFIENKNEKDEKCQQSL
jgi:hypothetical protein